MKRSVSRCSSLVVVTLLRLMCFKNGLWPQEAHRKTFSPSNWLAVQIRPPFNEDINLDWWARVNRVTSQSELLSVRTKRNQIGLINESFLNQVSTLGPKIIRPRHVRSCRRRFLAGSIELDCQRKSVICNCWLAINNLAVLAGRFWKLSGNLL